MAFDYQKELLDSDIFSQNQAALFSLLQGITTDKGLTLNGKHSNRYFIQFTSKEGGETICFSTPIYQKDSMNFIVRKFTQDKGYYRFVGSNCEVRVTGTQILMFQRGKKISFHFPKEISWKIHKGFLVSQNYILIPTYNGVAIRGDLTLLRFDVTIDFFYQRLRKSKSCLCFMEDKYDPVFVVSGLYALDKQGNKVPLRVRYVDDLNKSGFLSFESLIGFSSYGVFELDFYEPKLLQDTPVSSRYPDENNAFGAIAFVGDSEYYGSQWLYFRLDLSKIHEMKNANIEEIKLYVPSWNDADVSLRLYDLPSRFCSFGSSWNNKVEPKTMKKEITRQANFLCFDLTEEYTRSGRLAQCAGTVLLSHSRNKQSPQILSTGDCYIMPPFLWIKFTNSGK